MVDLLVAVAIVWLLVGLWDRFIAALSGPEARRWHRDRSNTGGTGWPL